MPRGGNDEASGEGCEEMVQSTANDAMNGPPSRRMLEWLRPSGLSALSVSCQEL